MDINDIALTSMAMSEAKFQMSASISMTKKAMEEQEMAAQQLLEMLPSTPGLGQHVDIRA